MEARGFAVASRMVGGCRCPGLHTRPSRAPLVVRSVLAQRRLDRNSSSVVKLAATSRTEDPVARRCDAGADVEAYVACLTQTFREIRLPLNGSLVRQEGSSGAEWKIVVPRLSFFDVWIQPVGMCQARSTKDSVLLEANHQGCTLTGSDAIHSLRLNDRFTLEHVHVSFKAKKPQASVGVPKLCIAFDMSVLVDVPPPFSFMPRHVVEATGQSGLQASFNVVMRSVAASMARDYQQWAVDPAHRSKLGRVLVAS